MRKILFGMLIFILASCNGSFGQSPQVSPTNQTTIVANLTQEPAATFVFIPDSETELSSIKDIEPTPLIEDTPIPLLDFYDLPDWMKDPEANIVAALITNDFENTRKIAFFSAATGEKFEISIPENISGYFWYDNANFGFLSKDLSTSYRINLPTGRVLTQGVSQEATRLLNQEYDDYENRAGATANELVLLKDFSMNDPVFERARWHDKSKSGRFTADWYGDNNTGIEVTDNKTNQVVWQSQLSDGMYGTEFIWSPNDEGQLAYLQGRPEPLNGFITESMVLTIVDVISGKVHASYTGDFGILRWSYDGDKILYQNAWSRYRNYGVGFRDAPCIVFLKLAEKRCLRSIPRFVPDGNNLETTGIYEWGIDNTDIFYTYIYSAPEGFIGNLCIYSLLDSHIDCPTQDLDALKGMTVVDYEVSPNRQFIHFCYSASSILNDYADTANDGMIKIDGTGFFSWVGVIQDGGPQSCSNGSIWRPLP